MADVPKYTLIEAQEAVDVLVRAIEFDFFTALSDLTDQKLAVDVGPVDGGAMQPHLDRRRLIAALVDRLLYNDEIVLYPAPVVGSTPEGQKP